MIIAMLNKNQNVTHTRHAFEELGAKVTCIEERARHTQVWFLTPNGAHEHLLVRRSPVDKHKLRGWARQAFNKAMAKGGAVTGNG